MEWLGWWEEGWNMFLREGDVIVHAICYIPRTPLTGRHYHVHTDSLECYTTLVSTQWTLSNQDNLGQKCVLMSEVS